jgi:hypothetical protein
MQIETGWQTRFPENDFEGALSFLNGLDWRLSISSSENRKALFGGDQLIFSCETQNELEAFVLGMALSFSVLPDEIMSKIIKMMHD